MKHNYTLDHLDGPNNILETKQPSPTNDDNSYHTPYTGPNRLRNI